MHAYFGPGAAVFYLIHTMVTPCYWSEHILYSKEGVTQGDPLSMLFYAVAVLPLIQSLKQLSKWHQSWYADDSACAGELQMVGNWFDLLLKLGPSYGYFPEPSKCFIIVAPSDIPAAHSLFKDLGVWSPQTEALFDIRIIDTDAPSYKHHTPEAVLESAAKEKKRIYQKAVEDRRSQFTPFVVSVDGLLHREANHFMKRIAASLAAKLEKSYSETVSFVRTRLSFAILRSASLCLHGSRVKW